MELGWSQQDMADRASAFLPAGSPLTQTTLSRMLNGAVSLRIELVEAIAKALDMKLSALCRLAEGEMPRSARAVPVTDRTESPPNGARRRRPRRVTGQNPGA